MLYYVVWILYRFSRFSPANKVLELDSKLIVTVINFVQLRVSSSLQRKWLRWRGTIQEKKTKKFSVGLQSDDVSQTSAFITDRALANQEAFCTAMRLFLYDWSEFLRCDVKIFMITANVIIGSTKKAKPPKRKYHVSNVKTSEIQS